MCDHQRTIEIEHSITIEVDDASSEEVKRIVDEAEEAAFERIHETLIEVLGERYLGGVASCRFPDQMAHGPSGAPTMTIEKQLREALADLANCVRGTVGTACEWEEHEFSFLCKTHAIHVSHIYDHCPVREAISLAFQPADQGVEGGDGS